MIEGFSESTVVATRWLIVHAPEDLPAWLARHERPALLERVAREEIERDRARKAAAEEKDKL